jgi:hypothetical protein
MHATMKELLEVVFSMRSAPIAYEGILEQKFFKPMPSEHLLESTPSSEVSI